jgi:hypothetical protein
MATLNDVGLQYDAFGRRTTNSTGTSFVYDMINPAQEKSGSTVMANLITGATDEVFSRADAGGSFTQLKDDSGRALRMIVTCWLYFTLARSLHRRKVRYR